MGVTPEPYSPGTRRQSPMLLPSSLTPVQLASLRVIWIGLVLSAVSDQVYLLAFPWLAYDLTGSAAALGIIRALEQLPPVLLGIIIGVLVDRFEMRRVLVVSGILSAFLMVLPAVAHAVGSLAIWQLYILSFLLAFLYFVEVTTWRAFITTLVPRSALADANATWSLIGNASSLLGPICGGALIAWIGATNSLWLAAVSYVIVALLILLIRIPSPTSPKGAEPASDKVELLKGFLHLTGQPLLRTSVGLLLVVRLVMGLVNALQLFYLRNEFTLDSKTTGLIMSVGGFGSIMTNLFIYRLVQPLPRGKVSLVSMAVLGTALAGLAVTQQWWQYAVLYATITGAVLILNINLLTTIQEFTPHHLLGRVIAATDMASGVALVASSGLAGMLANGTGARALFLVGGAMSLLVAFVSWTTPLSRLTSTAGE